MHQLLSPAKALRTLRKTPTILKAILGNTTQEQTRAIRDGQDGWSILEIMCHLHDIEILFMGRVRDLLNTPNPTFAVVSNEELMERGNYQARDLHATLAAYTTLRQEFIGILESINDEQWSLAGLHPSQGPATLLDVAVNTGLHDVDHIEQIARCLGRGL